MQFKNYYFFMILIYQNVVPLYDKYGNVYIVVDMELKGCIRESLIKMILNFDMDDMDLENE